MCVFARLHTKNAAALDKYLTPIDRFSVWLAILPWFDSVFYELGVVVVPIDLMSSVHGSHFSKNDDTFLTIIRSPDPGWTIQMSSIPPKPSGPPSNISILSKNPMRWFHSHAKRHGILRKWGLTFEGVVDVWFVHEHSHFYHHSLKEFITLFGQKPRSLRRFFGEGLLTLTPFGSR